MPAPRGRTVQWAARPGGLAEATLEEAAAFPGWGPPGLGGGGQHERPFRPASPGQGGL